MGAHGWDTTADRERFQEPPALAIQTLDFRGVRFVRLTHLIDWLEDVDGTLTVAEVRETLERVGDRTEESAR